MAIVVEDGTGLENSNSYVSVEDANAYFSTRAVTEWLTKALKDKEAALIKATDYIDQRWGPKLQGYPLTRDQALEFPRLGCYDRYGYLAEGVPMDIAKAACEYALITFDQSLGPANPTTSKEIKKKKVVVGPITTETEYVGSNSQTDTIKYPVADSYVKQFGRGGNGGVYR